ncbi:MAG: DinB family protein, partial [Anaerolineaceae bacterium]
VQRGLKVLSFSRADLLELIKDLPEETLDREYAGERWSIRGIVRHIANAEWWYQTRLGLENLDRRALPENIHERLAVVRARSEEILPQLEGKVNVAGIEGELWSPRKMLRRSAWHERDHIEHIRKLLAS